MEDHAAGKPRAAVFGGTLIWAPAEAAPEPPRLRGRYLFLDELIGGTLAC